jgi:hypothetical protein
MACEKKDGKKMNFIFCLGTAYNVSSMEDIENSWSFWLTGKACLPKCFISLILALSSGTLANLYFPLRRAYLFTFMQFLFLFESPSSLIKHQLESTIVILVHWM